MGRKMGGRFKREGIYVYLWLILKDRNGMDLTEAEEVARIHRTI